MLPSPREGAGTELRLRVGRALVVVVTVLLMGVAGGCSSDEDAGPAGRGHQDAGTQATHRDVRTHVVVGQVTGLLKRQQREQVAGRVAAVVDRWWEASFVGVDYPHRRFRSSFPGFTPGARDQAFAQRDVMTARRIGSRIDGLHALRRRVAVDVLAVGGRPRSATARVRMDLQTTGGLEQRIRVQGQLFLTLSKGWKVFGFDVTQQPMPRHQSTPEKAHKKAQGNDSRKGRR
ncbi:hypothetical protein [Nocardioides acrostichi]|uniref:Uncharacterized protein n=1 Tax=Nocardioides acrostichi TaxID=2784339 RepID=A0A930UXJ3_9ACTN|nr:hypothetical protein [Nocardioides acrostichi]MBF4160900.1 hypothetical protein [Nocardioides acrostichi]